MLGFKLIHDGERDPGQNDWNFVDNIFTCIFHQFITKQLPEPMLTSWQLDPQKKKLQSNLNHNRIFFFHKNAFENVVCKLWAILFRLQCVQSLWDSPQMRIRKDLCRKHLQQSYSCTHNTCTVRCCYNAVNFLTNIHKRHPIAHPLGRGMGWLLWIQHLIDILPQFL